MKKLIFILIIMFSISMLVGETYVKPGNVSGYWPRKGSPYFIQGDIAIPFNQYLQIEAGTKIIFEGYYQLNVYGLLYAVGTESKMITFHSDKSKRGWSGILFSQNELRKSSKLIYCRFQYKSNDVGHGVAQREFTKKNSKKDYGAAIELRGVDNLQISNCMISRLSPIMRGSGISLYNSSPEITENTIVGNHSYEGAGIYMDGKSHPVIYNNRIEKNISINGAAVCIRNSNPTLINNLIVDNYAYKSGGGMYIENNAHPLLINNTIVINEATQGGAFMCADNSDPAIYNSIIWGNKAKFGTQVYLFDEESDPDFLFCDIYKGDSYLHGFAGKGAEDYNGIYIKNLDMNPLFDYSNNIHPYSLMLESPCIDSALEELPVKPPCCDLAGNPRMSGKRLDRGGYEYQYQEDKSIVTYSTPVQLNGNYPNPANPNTVISFTVLEACQVEVSLYNVKGQKIRILENREYDTGLHELVWDGTDAEGKYVSSGVYYYKLRAGNHHDTKKMVFVK